MMDKDATSPEQEQTDVHLESVEHPVQETENGEFSSELNDKIAQLQASADESKNKYLYLLSDFENFKRNTARERIELRQTAGRDILSSLIPILDDFDRASKNGALSEGTLLIHTKLANILKSKGLTLMETNIGDNFNADEQEAVVEIPAPQEGMVGKVVDILEPGYFLGDKIIRFAKVIVGK